MIEILRTIICYEYDYIVAPPPRTFFVLTWKLIKPIFNQPVYWVRKGICNYALVGPDKWLLWKVGRKTTEQKEAVQRKKEIVSKTIYVPSN